MTDDDSADNDMEAPTDVVPLGATVAASSSYKVLGEFADGSGAGVLGKNTASSGTPIGVEGSVPNSSGGFGLFTADDAKIQSNLFVDNRVYVTTLDSGSVDFNLITGDKSDGAARNVIAGHNTNQVNDGVVGATISGGGYYDGSTLGVNLVKDDFGTVGGGRGNLAGDNASGTTTASLATVGGGRGNEAAATKSTVAGGSDNRTTGNFGAIGGGNSNVAGGRFSTIAGGRENQAATDYATVAGGNYNTATSGTAATIGGGTSSAAKAYHATIAGGQQNTASGYQATVGGGSNNIANGYQGTVAGGDGNTASGYQATVGGGDGNTASGYQATVGGGDENTAGGDKSTVAGGDTNTATSGTGGTVAGGTDNHAEAAYAVVGGGRANGVTGDYGTVPGGRANTAQKLYSFAAGRGATAQHEGAIVYGDSTTTTISSSNIDEFRIQHDFYAASVTEYSAAAAKTDVDPVDPEAVLGGVEDLDVSRWTYEWDETKHDDPPRHLGPMAGDFYEQFGVGTDPEHITNVDANGVAFAAIQGLANRVDEGRESLREQLAEKEARIDDLEAENTELRERLTALETKVEATTQPTND